MVQYLLTAIIVSHFLWIAFVVTGWIYCLYSPFWRLTHFGSVVYSLLIEVLYFPCPLTMLENYLREQIGLATYHEPFIDHYLNRIIYLEAPRWLLILMASLLFVVTVVRYWRAIGRKFGASCP